MDADPGRAADDKAEKFRQADIDRARARGVNLNGPGFAGFGHANGHGLADTTANVAQQNVAGAFRSVQWARPALRALWSSTKGVGRFGKRLLRSLLGALSRLRARRAQRAEQRWRPDDQITRPELPERVAEDTAAAVRGIDPVRLANVLREALKDHPEIPEAVLQRLTDPAELAKILQGVDAKAVNMVVRTNLDDLHDSLNEVWGERLGGIARFPEYRDFERTWRVTEDPRWQITNASADDLMAVMASAAASSDPEAQKALGRAESELRERSPLMYDAYQREKQAVEAAGPAKPAAETRAQAVLAGLAKAALYETEPRMPVDEFHRAKVEYREWLSDTDRDQVKDTVDALQARAEAGDEDAPVLLDKAMLRLSAENPEVAGRYLELMFEEPVRDAADVFKQIRAETDGHPFDPGAKLKVGGETKSADASKTAERTDERSRSQPIVNVFVVAGDDVRGADPGGRRGPLERAGDHLRRHGGVLNASGEGGRRGR
ncbi:hypothetical protein [Marinactinospora rubrisoli]|uniref:Uncharacterized protein n=1 Tax=Marinactinospora rubrisoli TaxID=2715399 RepID=A0ABW2KPK9_9ACTN